MGKKLILILGLSAVVSCACIAQERRTVYRNRNGETIGSETVFTHSDGSKSYTYRDANGRTIGTAGERVSSTGERIKTYRNNAGETTGHETENMRTGSRK